MQSEDPESFAPELVQLIATRAHHSQRLTELEENKEAVVTVTTTQCNTRLRLPPHEIVTAPQPSSIPFEFMWSPLQNGHHDHCVNSNFTQWTAGKIQTQEVVSLVADPEVPLNGTFVRQWRSRGRGDGDGEFQTLQGLAVDQQTGNVFACDWDNSRVQVFSSDGEFLRVWGSEGTGEGQLDQPFAIALNDGNVYITDSNNNRVCVFDIYGTYKWQWGSEGSGDGEFDLPRGIAVSGDEIFVADDANHRVQVFDKRGRYKRQWGTEGDGEGQFNQPNGIAVCGGNELFVDELFVCDYGNHRVVVYSVDGSYLRHWGGRGSGQGQFRNPMFVEVIGTKVVVSDFGNHRLQVFGLDGTFITQWGNEGNDPGQFAFPLGLAMGPEGELFVSEIRNERVQVFS